MKLWSPSPRTIADANVTKLIKQIEQAQGSSFSDYNAFRNWTVSSPAKFWTHVWEFCEVIHSKPYRSVVEKGDQMPGAEWFPGAELNFAKNLLRFSDEQNAIIFWNEKGPYSRLSYAEVFERVVCFRSALSTLGLKPGDKVAALLPNIPEVILLMLASTSLGLVWSSASPDFSAQGVLDRFSQIAPKVLFTCDSYLYKGQKISLEEKTAKVREGLPSLILTLKVSYLEKSSKLSSAVKDLQEFAGEYGTEISDFVELPASHPLYILFSSGTTGAPKCIVHSAAGILLEHLKELTFEADLKRSDKFFFATSCGWMMWNWMASALALGSTILLYDGYPLAKNGNILFDFAQEEGMTVFGTSAAFLQKIEELNLRPKETHNLERLRSILSTGSRLKPHSFDYVYKAIGDVHLSPIWGGTDLCGCLGTSSPLLPVIRDEIQTRGLGLDVDVVNEKAESIRDQAGEVVVRKPFPSMPLYFLNDNDGAKYRAAYFEQFPGMWRHGDLAILTHSDGITVLGRSDDTLNPGGVRIGAAEVTGAAEKVEGVLEAMAVPKELNGDERIILFVILSPGVELDQKLKDKIQEAMPSPRHRPKEIIAVPDLPLTVSGKRSPKALRDTINGREPANRDALANPQVLDWFKNLPELKIT